MPCRSAKESWKMVTRVRESRAIRALDYSNTKHEQEVIQSRKNVNVEVIRVLINTLKENDFESIPEVKAEMNKWNRLVDDSQQVKFTPHRVQAFIRLGNALKESRHTELLPRLSIIEREIKNVEKEMLAQISSN